jgi:hypothetical protein
MEVLAAAGFQTDNKLYLKREFLYKWMKDKQKLGPNEEKTMFNTRGFKGSCNILEQLMQANLYLHLHNASSSAL